MWRQSMQRHCQTKFYTASWRAGAGWSPTVFAQKSPTRSARFDAENDLYSFALTVPQEHPAVSLAAAIGSPDAYAGEVPVAYAQLRPGASVTEEELLEFAARLIPERAAVPKRIRISSALPMTAVGKIFKPALYALEVEAAIRSEADKIGVTIEAINIEREPRTGLTARVHAVGDARDLRAALDRYAFKAECLPSKILRFDRPPGARSGHMLAKPRADLRFADVA